MPTGRPSSYDPAYCERARELCEGGAVDADIAADVGIALSTLYSWKASFPEFKEALKRGKDVADDMVENALFRRATGYTFDSVKIMSVSQGAGQPAQVEQIPFVEHVPPDTTAGIFWLKNRRRDLWRDRVDQTVSGELSVKQEFDGSHLSKDERQVFAALLAKMKKGAEK